MPRLNAWKKRWFGLAAFLIGSFLAPAISDDSVRLWEEPLVIPTYEAGSPDANPLFYNGRAYQGAKGPVYPYPMLDRLTEVRVDKSYQAVFLENRYVKLCILPELGGRIFYALDKTIGYNLFYRQHVVKPALIGMLGAWLSGGVEWNVPHHHRATSFMPVDYTLADHPDGSKTLWVGELEYRHRMKWIVGLTLKPGSACIEVTMRLFNPTPFAHSFLCWANVAVHTNPSYQVVFPPETGLATFHGKNEFARWPLSHEVYRGVDYSSGVDVSWWKNHPKATSMFAWESRGDFLAGYDHGKDAGVVFVADHHEVPGKKLWTWGTGAEGKRWERILTDADGPYLELMIGAYSDNQPDYSWIHPFEVKSVKQYWYPLRKIKGVKKANPAAAVNLEVAGRTARIGFYTTASHRDAKVVLGALDQVLFEQVIHIGPEEPYVKEIALTEGLKEEDLHVTLFTARGEPLMAYRPVKKDRPPMPEPVEPPPPPEKIKTIEALYLTGLRLEQFHNPALEPYPFYEEALRRDPGDSRTNTALGLLDLKRGLFERGEEKLRRAVKRLTHNYTRPKEGEAFYYLGVALRAQGKVEEAADAFHRAAWDSAFHSAAHYQLAEAACANAAYSRALAHLKESLSSNYANTGALNLEAAILRRLGLLEDAERAVHAARFIDPLNFRAGNELYLIPMALGLTEEAHDRLESLEIMMRDEPHAYLEVAAGYARCGLWDEAIGVLSRLIESNAAYPMLYYYRGRFQERVGRYEEALADYDLAAGMPPAYCFPFRLESIRLLEHVIRTNPKDARAPYYLGNLLYDLQPGRAIAAWEASRDRDGSFAMVHRNLGLAYAREEQNLKKAFSSLEKAQACNRKDPRIYQELDLISERAGISPGKRLALLEENIDTVIQRDDALSRLISLYILTGRYAKALDHLATHHFHLWEGGGRIHDIFVDAHLLAGREELINGRSQKALAHFESALCYPENLEAGKPLHNQRVSQIHYFIGEAHEALRDGEKSRASYERAAGAKQMPEWTKNRYYQGLAHGKLGKNEEAQIAFNGLIGFGRGRLDTGRSIDFFAKFGEKEAKEKQRANAHFLVGLGHLGNGDRMAAKEEFEEALTLNPNHLWAKTFRDA